MLVSRNVFHVVSALQSIVFILFGADQVSCRSYVGSVYRMRPLAVSHSSVDNTLLVLQNSSYPTQPHSIIANYTMLYEYGKRTRDIFEAFLFFLSFNKTIIPLALVGYELIIANSTLCTSLAIYHLIFNAREYHTSE